ncbi:MAG: tetratricopeptide repeat protein, partial [Kofleriaceae bacterium]
PASEPPTPTERATEPRDQRDERREDRRDDARDDRRDDARDDRRDEVTPGGGNDDGAGSPSAAQAGSNADRSDRSNDDRTKKAQNGKATSKRIAAVDDRPGDPKALIKQGKAFERAGEWDQARGIYQKLEKVKGHAAQALYLQAWAAINSNDTTAAVQLAKRSVEQPGGGDKTDAKFLYGDALYKLGEYQRAKDVYVNLRKSLAGDQRSLAAKKIAAANRQLKLPESDGVVD